MKVLFAFIVSCALFVTSSIVYMNQFSSIGISNKNKKFQPIFESRAIFTNSLKNQTTGKMLDSSCLGMFDIGFNNNKIKRRKDYHRFTFTGSVTKKDWNRLMREKEKSTQSNEDYEPLVKSLAKVVTLSQGKLIIQNKTRLQIMNGQLPYTTCAVKEYGPNETKHCFQSLSERKKKIWIVFMGDSRMRNMLLFLTKRTQDIMKWSLSLKEGETENFDDIVYLHDYATWLNASTHSGGHLMSYVGAIYGLKNTHPPHPIRFLQELLKFPEKLPDLLLINFGSWEYKLPITESILTPHSETISIWKKLSNILKILSQHMTIICVSLPRPRSTSMKMLAKGAVRKDRYYFHRIMEDSSQFVDDTIREFTKNSDVIFWDSTVPFYLAARRECNDLFQHNRTFLDAELKLKTPFPPFMCHDLIHKSSSTLQDETTMIFNLICNKFSSSNANKYCCS